MKKVLSTTHARKHISELVAAARGGSVFVLGRRNGPEAILMEFPASYNPLLSDIANINAYSHSFDFLHNEPDLYSVQDLKKRYA